jgi:anaerobic selenocysteine-containing dehydrogenase
MPEWGRTQSPYCGVGRGLLVQIQAGEVVRVKGDPDHPANFGEVCAKAVMLPRALNTPDRLLYPHVRSRRDRPLTRVPWSVALKTVAQSFRSIIAEYGPDAIAFYGSGQLLTEAYYVANQSMVGVGKDNALINLHLVTGQIGAPGAGPFSLTGQPNAMGGREVGGLSHLLPGYRSVLEPQHRAEVAAHWGIPPEHLSAKPGYSAVASGICFVPFHWGRSMGFYKYANNLTLNAYDPVSKEPELKAPPFG